MTDQPSRRAEDAIRDQVKKDPAALIAEFVKEVDNRLLKLEKQLKRRYIVFIVGFLVVGFFLWQGVQDTSSAAGQARTAAMNATTAQRKTDKLARTNHTLALQNRKLTKQVAENQARIAHNQQANTRALCAFRSDLEKRIDAGTQFLQDHPEGIPGVPADAIRVSILNEQSTLNSLSRKSTGLVCPKTPVSGIPNRVGRFVITVLPAL